MQRFRLSVVVPILIAVFLFAIEAFSKGPSEIALMFKELRTGLSDITGRLDRLELLVKDLSTRLPSQTTNTAPDVEKGQEAYARGRIAEQLNDCARALPDLTKAVQLDPGNDSAFLHRGFCNLNLNNVADALADAEQSLRLQPNNARAYEFRSLLHRMLNQPGLALDDLEQSVQRDPTVSSFMKAAELAQDLGSLPKAIDFYSRAQLLDPASATLYVKRAGAYKLNHREEEGLADCERALTVSQGFAEGYYCRADSYLRKGMFAQAVSDLNEVIRRQPDFAGAKELLATAQQMIAVNDSAVAAAQPKPDVPVSSASPVAVQIATKPEPATQPVEAKALPVRTKEARMLAEAGRTAAQNGRLNEAVQILTQAIQMDPSEAKHFNARGYALLRLRQYRQALDDFNQALMLQPNYANAFSNRVVALRLIAGERTLRSSKGSN